MTKTDNAKRREWQILFALLLLTVVAFWPVRHCEFLDYDDPDYVAGNKNVQQGLTLTSIGWAFRTIVVSNWHPITCLSHIIDWEMFGNNPGAHHLMNLFFHALNTILLFRLLRRSTGELWPSAVVAALFGVHPLHVESVAWVSERKDVLSTFFGLLTIWAYLSYVGSRNKPGGQRRWFYLLAIVFFALGLMSKPMLVTWPFVLLLLDFWPLKRFSMGGPSAPGSGAVPRAGPKLKNVFLEKLPFFAMAGAHSVLTLLTQRGAMMALEHLSMSARICNALVSYAIYLAKTFWPTNLAILYPHPDAFERLEVAGAAGLLVLISILVLWQYRARPFLFFGWFWFVGTLVPVIGLVQVGLQAMADRYTYIPLIGLFVAIVWLVRDLAAGLRLKTASLNAAWIVIVLTCVVGTRLQLRYWRNHEVLFQHALDVTSNKTKYSFLAHIIVGRGMIARGQLDDGIEHLTEALRLKPEGNDGDVIRCERAEALMRQGKTKEAIEQYREAIRYKPDFAQVYNNIAWILATNDDPAIRDGEEAVRMALRACELSEYKRAICIGTLAAANAETGRFDEAIRNAERAHDLAAAAGDRSLAQRNTELLELYRAGKPYREPRRKQQ